MEADSNRDVLALFAAWAIFLVLTSSWVWHDARRRGARKPLLAAVLAIFQGPLWLAFYLADRPLCADERRQGGFGWNFARNLRSPRRIDVARSVLRTVPLPCGTATNDP